MVFQTAARFVYQSIESKPIFVHDALDKRERTFRPVQMKGFDFQASWESHPSEDLSETPSFVATAHGTLPLQRSTLGLDASIIIASACHGLRCGCAETSES